VCHKCDTLVTQKCVKIQLFQFFFYSDILCGLWFFSIPEYVLGIIEIKKCYQFRTNTVKNRKGNLVAHSHSILASCRKHFFQLLNMRVVNDIRHRKKENISFIFNDESTGSCVCLRLNLYMSHVKKHETVIICASADSFYFSYSPTHSATRAHTCAYVTRTYQ
jgi:hypothetical protein